MTLNKTVIVLLSETYASVIEERLNIKILNKTGYPSPFNQMKIYSSAYFYLNDNAVLKLLEWSEPCEITSLPIMQCTK